MFSLIFNNVMLKKNKQRYIDEIIRVSRIPAQHYIVEIKIMCIADFAVYYNCESIAVFVTQN